MDTQLIGATALIALATVGITPEIAIPENFIIIGCAITGSLQAAFARKRGGYVKGRGPIIWAIFAGITCGLLFGGAFSEKLQLTDTMAHMLPVYIFALLGGRLIMWFSTGINIEKIGNSIVDRILKK